MEAEMIFYFLGVIFVIYEILCIYDPEAILVMNNELRSKQKTDASEFYFTYTLLYTIYLFIGLGTFQWPFFTLIFVISSLLSQNKIQIIKTKSMINLLILIFIYINKIHIHYYF